MNVDKIKNGKFIVLDRDGVINLDSDDFIKSPEEWQPIAGSIEAIGRLHKAGYSIYILTNQSGIARKLFSLNMLKRIHQKLVKAVQKVGGDIAGIYFCPHGPDDNCLCRKPLSGLYDQLASDLPQKTSNTFAGVFSVGDSIRDLQAAKSAGAIPILVTTGKGLKSRQAILEDPQYSDLLDVAIFSSLADYTEQLLS